MRMTETTANQLKGMALAVADTMIIAAGLAAWSATHRHAFDTSTIASAGLTFALPFGALLGRVATRRHDRLEVIFVVAILMVLPCALVAWQALTANNQGFELAVIAGAMWAPTSLLALVLERWTRPETPIPTCTVYKTLL